MTQNNFKCNASKLAIVDISQNIKIDNSANTVVTVNLTAVVVVNHK